MKFQLTDFRALRYNVVLAPINKKIEEIFPDLNFIHKIVVPEGCNRDQMLRVAILLYDPGSPLNKVTKTEERAHLACVYAGIEHDKATSTYPDWVTEMVSGAMVEFNQIAMYYLTLIENSQVATLRALKMASLNLTPQIAKGDIKAIETLTKLEKEITERQRVLTNGYMISDKMFLDIDAFLIDSELDLSPEGMATKRQMHRELFPELNVYR